MAEEIAEEGGGGSSGSVLKKYGPLAGIVLLAQVVLAWVVIEFALKDNIPEQQPDPLIPEAEAAPRGGADEERTALPFLYSSPELKSITANPAGTNASRFVMFTVRLGLVARDHDENPPKDITDSLKDDADLLAKIGEYDAMIKEIITQIVRLKTVDELDAERIDEVKDEIKLRLNKDIFQKLFQIDDDNKREVQVHKVIFADFIIQ